MTKAKGSCLCGGVRFEIEGPHMLFQYCHCSRCRKGTGSAHASNLFAAPSNFRWISGEELVKVWELPTAKYFCKAFCSECGSAAPYLAKSGKAFVVPAGLLDDDPGE
ncbi:MAG: GFA family protein, partial [Myxococcales bacterium]|nr:GFA family protein [Myxococcales bacterium]